MMLKRFAQFLLERRNNAVLLALLFSIVGFLRWVGSVIAGFVTLRKGPWEGGVVFLWTLLPIIVAWTARPDYWLSCVVIIAMQFTFWLMAIVMGYRQDYRSSLFLLVAISCLALVGLVWWLGDVNQWIVNATKQLIDREEPILSSGQISQAKAYFDQFKAFSKSDPAVAAMIGFGFPALLINLWITVNLLIARMMDCSLDKPRQFSQEFGLISMPYSYSILVLLVIAVGIYLESTLLMVLVPVLAFPLVIAGISLIHYLIINTNAPNFLLFVFYLAIMMSLLFLVTLPIIVLIVTLPIIVLIFMFVALIDSVFNCRGRLSSIL